MAGAAVRHEQHFRAGEFLQQEPADLRRRILIDEFGVARMRFHVSDQRFEIIGRQRFLRHQQHRIDRDQADWREVGPQIEADIVDDAADVRVPLADIDRVTVGRCAREPADADRTAGAADIFHNHWLAERRAHLVGHDAGRHVGRSARRERHDQRDRARGVIVGMRGRKQRDESKRKRK
jgi:hypothetical protein